MKSKHPEPAQTILEGCPEDGFEDKSLGLWDIAVLPILLPDAGGTGEPLND